MTNRAERAIRFLAFAALAFAPSLSHAQSVPLQAGPVVPGHIPIYAGSGSGQPIFQDSGPASGAGPGLSEQLLIARGRGSPPYANTGTGPLGTNWCDYDGPTTGAYHYLCLGANAQGGGMLTYGAGGGAAQLPLTLNINGTAYQYPFVLRGVVGPNTTTVGHAVQFGNTTGSTIQDGGTLSPNVAASGYGADTTGATDASAAFTSAFSAAAAGPQSAFVPTGSYKINSSVPLPVNTTAELEGAVLSGSGGIYNGTDASPLLGRFAHVFMQHTNAAGNQDAVFSSLFIDNTGGAAAYEKAAGYFAVLTNDPSVGGTSRDATGILSSATVGNNNANGHIYGGNSYANYPCNLVSGSCTTDGSGESWEFNSANYSSDQSVPSSTLAKTGIGLVAQGTVPSTSAIHISASINNGWHNGIVIDQGTISDSAIRIIQANTTSTDVFHVLPSGSTLVNDLSIYTGNLTAPNGVVTILGGSNPTTLNVNNVGITGTNRLSINAGTATGIAPTITASGADANVSIAYQTKATGAHLFYVNGTSMATIDSSGLTTMNVISSGNFSPSYQTSIAAAGTTQATATVLTKDMNFILSGTGGVIVPASSLFPTRRDIWNYTGSAVSAYPPVGASFLGSSLNAPVSVAVSGHVAVICYSATACASAP